MINFNICKSIRKVVDSYKDLGIGRLSSYSNLSCLFSLYFFKLTSLSDVVRFCPWSHSVSDLSRSILGFQGNRFVRRYRLKILKKYRNNLDMNNFCFAIDDTSNPRYGRNIYASHNWHDSKSYFFGQKILVLALVDIKNGFAIPIHYIFAKKKTDPNYKSMLDLSINLLKDILAQGFPRLPVVVDSWFDGAEFISKIKNLNFPYVGQLKSNRYVCSKRSTGWINIKRYFTNKKRYKIIRVNRSNKWSSRAVIYIRKLSFPLKAIAVYNRKNGINSFGL